MTLRQLLFDRPVPAGWRMMKVDQIKADEHASCSAGPFGSNISSKYFVEEGIPVIRGANLRDDLTRFVPEGFVFVSSDRTKAYKGQHVRAGDLVFTCWGTLGQVGLIPKNGPYQEYIISNKQLKLRPNTSIADPLFLFYYFACPEMVKYILSIAIGAAVPGINLGLLKNLDVVMPPIAVQRKIVGLLSAYDDLIENNTRRIAILEAMAQAIYREWFVEFRFPGHEKVKLVDSPLGKIPEGWRWAKLKDVCDSVNYGYTASANKEVEVGPKFLRITDIVPTTIDWERLASCEMDSDDVEKYALHEGDIVIARTGATTGYAKQLNKRHPKAVFASYLVRISPKAALGKHYIGVIVESDEYKDFIKRNLGGAAQPQANAQVLTSLDTLVPPPELMTAFDVLMEPLADKKEILQLKNRNLRKTRDLLLPKLISGQLDVEDLDIDTGQQEEADA